jgi:hypothetical protein
MTYNIKIYLAKENFKDLKYIILIEKFSIKYINKYY